MPDIFLSYTREDLATAQRYAEAFQAEGLTVWWDATLRSGEAYDQVTEEALRTAKAVVVLWSKKSVVSRWVRAEATLADRNRTLVPAMIEPCDRPIMFELTQTADLSGWTGEGGAPAWRAFLADVRRFVGSGGDAAPRTPPTTPQSPGGAPPALAVLPLINRSGHAEDELFAGGLVEDLTTALSTSFWARVVAASATAAYRNPVRDLRQIGRDLGVRYLLEGNVRRTAAALRLTAQLVEAESGNILWAEKFDRPLTDLLAQQDDFVAELAARLGVQLHRIEIDHALRKPHDAGDWEMLMRSNAYSSYATRQGWEAAVVEGRRAVERHPDDAAVYANLAAAQGQLLHYGGGDPGLMREVLDNVRRARALDPVNPEVLNGIASALACVGRLEEAMPLIERAIAINPSFPIARLVRGMLLARLGRPEDAIAELDAYDRLAPDGVWLYYARTWRSSAHLQAGRLEEALAAADEAVRLLPATEALIQSTLCLAMLGRWNGVREVMHRLRDTDPEMSAATLERIVGNLYRGSGSADELAALARRAWDESDAPDDVPPARPPETRSEPPSPG